MSSSPRLVGLGETGRDYVVSRDVTEPKTLIISLKREEKEQKNRVVVVWQLRKEGSWAREGRSDGRDARRVKDEREPEKVLERKGKCMVR